mgnify:CR=1 FL=1
MNKEKTIETIARGVVVKGGRLLLCHTKGKRNTYLPGGHIDFGERAQDALERELREELGVKSRAGRFIGVVEHCYRRGGKLQCEINLVFDVKAKKLKPGKKPISREDYIEFFWIPLAEIGRSALEPRVLRDVIGDWIRNKHGGAGWASTVGSVHGKSF